VRAQRISLFNFRNILGPLTARAGDVMTITKTIATTIAAFALLTTSALAADIVRKAPAKAPEAPPPPCDLAFGGGVQSDYNFRGISQTDRGPGVWAYAEPRCKVHPNIELYAGIWGWSTKLPTQPTGEFDLYAGIRPTIGPLAFDFGFMYYWYPKETQYWIDATGVNVTTAFTGNPLTLSDTDYWEVYGKLTWTVNEWLSLSPYVYYSPDWLNTGAKGTYAGGIVKVTLPSTWFPSDWGGYVSAEGAHYWLGTATAFQPFIAPFDLPDYTYWNAGFGITYKQITFDLRYHDTDLSTAQCFLLTGDPRGVTSGTATSKWCGATVIGKLSFDLTALGLK
jgi:uncharacterized protein (TIGR02001 family)